MSNRRHPAIVILLFGLLAFSSSPAVWAQDVPGSDVSIQISQDTAAMVAGDWVEFNTVLHNEGESSTPPLVAHLNIAAVRRGRYVDPEDWSPERTKYVQQIQPGDSIELAWKVHALVEGEFATFVTIISPEGSFEPAVSKSLLLHVTPDNILPMSEVIPVVAIVPIFPLALVLWGVAKRRRRPLRVAPRVVS